MVVFTCSHCGESLKKPTVSKHYKTKCKNSTPFVTCVDCLKDFKGDEYEAHTKCVTEEERYSAKGFVPNNSSNKGQKKQEAWVECVQGLLSSGNLKSDETNLLQSIVKFGNIPRKKAKFINFLKTTAKQHANKAELIDRVWEKLENYFKIASSAKEDENGNESAGGNKKRKHDEDQDNNTNESENKKKKKKTKKEDGGSESNTAENGDIVADVTATKKKKRKKGSATAEVSENEEPKNKKSKDAGEPKSEEEADKKVGANKENLSEEKKKCKNTAKNGAQTVKQVPFNWALTIVNVLSDSNKSLPLKTLQEKVLEKYREIVGQEVNQKVIKKFTKKLHMVSEVTINDDQVSLNK